MYTYLTEYKGADALENFIRINNLNKNKSILFQVFCGKGNQFYISGIIDDISNIAPNATIIGATAHGEYFLNNEKTNKSFIVLYETDQKKLNHSLFQFVIEMCMIVLQRWGKYSSKTTLRMRFYMPLKSPKKILNQEMQKNTLILSIQAHRGL